ncbi:hypothetical protein KBTX_01705 [wastewater metagenome]|uniref:L,D-TPase catalytic domain-containing protein n=2 Tax=unclassified sequences TaxID=12908 RepID=A0A5B8RD20_9ZZZZ|nr:MULTISPECIES: L,D-transpeptidase [Arhodomonas]QEA05384.1 hypothetical protein KBTEX_01705 [uncultured organism]
MSPRGVLLALLFLVLAPAAAAAPWVLVDTDRDLVEVRDGGRVVDVFEDISWGRGGVADLHLNGDDTTPTGDYRVTRIDRSSRFHVFIGLDYPTLEHLSRAYQRGVIDNARYRELREIAYDGRPLPQDTVLGGYIGLHGLGRADPEWHERFHWTEGCIALTDAQIDRLLGYIHEGSRVVIR